MKLKKTLCFETSDGKTFTDKGEAVKNECFVSMRAFIQNELGHGVALTSTNVAELLNRKSEEMQKLLQGINAAKRRTVKKG